MKEPFFGIVLASLCKEENKKCPTLGVAPDGATFKLIYNPDFLDRFSDNTILELLKHEVEHICFEHMFIGQETGFDAENHKLFNVACDLECNSYLDRSVMDASVGGCWAEDFGYKKEQGSRYYYENLREDPKVQEQLDGEDDDDGDDSGQSGGKKGQGNGKRPLDDHSQWPKMTRAEAERAKQQVEQMLVDAAEAAEKSQSYDGIPEALKIRIDKLRQKSKPLADWRRYCRRFMGNEYSYLTKKSRRRESKRFPGMMGTRHQRNSKILVAIDTSGSVSMPEYMEFMGQVHTMKGTIEFDIVECDTEIRHMYTYKNRANEQLHGGGGTSFVPPIRLFNESGKYDALVYFTDGECDIPDETPKDTLWIISSRGRKENNYTKNGAKVLFIPPKNE